MLRPKQVGAPGGAVEQRTPGEHPGHLAAGFQHVAQVGEGVPRGGQHPQPQRVADLDRVAAGDRRPVERDRVGGVDQVRRAGGRGKGGPASEVVVVDVRLGDVGDPHFVLRGQCGDPVGVPLRVDDQGGAAVVDQVAAVAKARRLDRQYLGHVPRLPAPSPEP